MVTVTKALYCFILLALVLTSCMARTVREAGEVDNVARDRRSSILGMEKASIAKRDLKYSFVT